MKDSINKNSERSHRSSQERPHQLGLAGPQAGVLTLQRAAGNRAISQVLQSDTGTIPGIQTNLTDNMIMDRTENENMLQEKFTPPEKPNQPHDDVVQVENRQGLPRSLKSGLETLSDLDLSGVRVHGNSPKPGQLNAFAYTEGQNIHVGPGQEKYLPHEGWHAVQQMQGRVQPTIQAKGVSINDDVGLEREADVMGAKALQQNPSHTRRPLTRSQQPMVSTHGSQPTIQRALKFEFQTNNYIWLVDKRGKDPIPLGYRRGRSDRRKLGRRGFSEDGSLPTFLAVGRQGYPEVRPWSAKRPWNMVKVKKDEIDETKASQFIKTYRVTRDPEGEFTLGDERVSVALVDEVNNRRVKGMRGKFNRGIYEFIYLDADSNDKEMNVHRDPNGNFQYGKIKRMRKAGKKDVEEGTAIELQLENHGILEFETPKWFRSWCALRLRIREAYEITQAIKKSNDIDDEGLEDAINKKISSLIEEGKRPSRYKKMGRLVEWPAAYPMDQLPRRVLKGGRLIIEIVDEDWNAKIQPSEGISLTQYESLLKEHHPSGASRSKRYTEEILKGGEIDRKKSPQLYSFLQMISYYIERGQLQDIRKKDENKKPILYKRGKKKGKPKLDPAKYAFALMSRTSFSSIFRTLLSDDEKLLFIELVENNDIVPSLNKMNPELILTKNSRFFKHGHGGGRGPTIHNWLRSIIDPGEFKTRGRKRTKDLLSPPVSGSAAMGRFEVEEREGKKDTDLVKFEYRSGPTIPSAKWEDYAKKIFKSASDNRKRDDGTDLIYEESEKCADTYFGYQKAKEEKKTEEKNKATSRLPEAGGTTETDYEFVPKLTLTLGDEKKPGFEADFRIVFPNLIDGPLKPFVLGGIGYGGFSVGGGASLDPLKDMSLFLAGKGAIRSKWFTSVDIGVGLEAGWIFDESHSLRLGIGWDMWQQLTSDQKRTHLLNLFIGTSF